MAYFFKDCLAMASNMWIININFITISARVMGHLHVHVPIMRHHLPTERQLSYIEL